MKFLILLFFSLLLYECANTKKVYWCGDHACINKKEKEAYFKKTMIIEIKELNKKDKKNESELEKIKKQAGLELEKEILNEKELVKQARIEEKRKIKEKKMSSRQTRLIEEKKRIKEAKEARELTKQVRLEEKRRIKEEKKLAKQTRLEKKRSASDIWKKEKKSSKKKVQKNENKEIVIDTDIAKTNISSSKFKELVEKITKKNMFRSYPNINDIPN